MHELLLTKLAAAACREDAEATTAVDAEAVEAVVALESVAAVESAAPITTELEARRRIAILEKADTIVTVCKKRKQKG